MAKVAREMLERTAVNVDQLVELLVKNAVDCPPDAPCPRRTRLRKLPPI